MYRYIIIILIVILNSCDSSKDQMIKELIIKDSFAQAIGKEFLPEIKNVFVKDTIFIMPLKFISTSGNQKIFNKEIIHLLPSHVGKWEIKIIDSIALNLLNDSYYISFIENPENEGYTIDFIIERYLQDTNKVFIDRGRLTIIYDSNLAVPTIKKIWQWWG